MTSRSAAGSLARMLGRFFKAMMSYEDHGFVVRTVLGVAAFIVAVGSIGGAGGRIFFYVIAGLMVADFAVIFLRLSLRRLRRRRKPCLK